MAEATLPPGIGHMMEALCGLCLEAGCTHRQLAHSLQETFLRVYQRRLDLLMQADAVPSQALEK